MSDNKETDARPVYYRLLVGNGVFGLNLRKKVMNSASRQPKIHRLREVSSYLNFLDIPTALASRAYIILYICSASLKVY